MLAVALKCRRQLVTAYAIQTCYIPLKVLDNSSVAMGKEEVERECVGAGTGVLSLTGFETAESLAGL